MPLLLGFVVAQIIIFAVIIIVLKRLIFEDTTSAVNRLTKLDTMNREKEKVLVEKLENAEKFFEKRRKELEEEEKKLKLEAQRAANQLHEDIVKQAKTEAEEIVKKAQASKDRMRIEALVEAEAKTIEFCVEILGKVLGALVQASMNEQIVHEFMGELEKADLSKISKEVKQVELFTGRNVSVNTQKSIKDLLEKKMERPLELIFKEDPALLGGVMMKFGTLVIDASLVERLKETATELKESLSWRHTV